MPKYFFLLFTALFTFANTLSADFKYSFVDIDYLYTDFDDSRVDGAHGVRGTIRVSLFENFFITGGIAMSKADADLQQWDVETTRLHLGLGGYVELVEALHLVGEAGLVYSELDTDLRSIQRDEVGVYAKPGVRVAVGPTLELGGNMIFSTIENEEFSVELGAGLNLFDNLQLKGGVEFQDESNIFSAGLRVQW